MDTVKTDLPGDAVPRDLLARAVGILTSPRHTFAGVIAHPKWLGMLALTVAIGMVCTGTLLSTEKGQVALVDQQVRTLESFGQAVDDAAYAQLEERSRYGGAIGAVQMLVVAPLVALVVAGASYRLFAVSGGSGTFRQVFAVVVHSGVVLAIQQLFVTPLNYVRESISGATNLAVFLPMLDEGSLPARFFGMIDLFIVWWIVTLAIGLSVLSGRRTVRIATGLFAVYIGLALILAIVMAVAGGT